MCSNYNASKYARHVTFNYSNFSLLDRENNFHWEEKMRASLKFFEKNVLIFQDEFDVHMLAPYIVAIMYVME